MKYLHCIGLALIPLALSGLAPTAPGGPPLPQEGVQELVEELKLKTDSADAELVRTLANLKTKEALDGLLEVYEVMNSIYMRRAVLRGLALFDDVPGEEQRALQRMMDAATNSSEQQMREIAVEEIARCRNYGKAFLAMIVESDAEDDVRVAALRRHAGSPRPEDNAWYLGIYDPSTKEKKRSPSGDEKPAPRPLPELRRIAFAAIVGDLETDEVVEAASGGDRAIRRRALQELDSRGDERAVEFAERLLANPQARAEDRLFAVDIVLRENGVKDVKKMIKAATRPGTPEAYSLGLARLLGDLGDEAVNKELLKAFGKGKGLRKLFSIEAVRTLEDEKIDKGLVKLLKDKEPRIQELAMELVAERRVTDALPELEKILEKPKDATLLDDAFDTITALRAADREWQAKLVEFTGHENADLRNSAIQALGSTGDAQFLPVLLQGLEHGLWSTRLAAARGLERLRKKEGVAALCARIPREDGRMALELGEILYRLTGKPYRNQGRLWERWWNEEGATFEFVTAAELRKLDREEEARRLRQVSRSAFFGIEIESTRVIFILDVSGSMEEPVQGRYVGSPGAPRIDVARHELSRCLDSLDVKSLFNMIVFSDGVEGWKDQISAKDEESIADAKAFVERLHAGGSTNLFGALTLAFEDEEVDTIYVLSDGEPTSGHLTDPGAIRAQVAEWNEHRDVTIHCIAVGGSLQILEWLAADTGGTYVKYR